MPKNCREREIYTSSDVTFLKWWSLPFQERCFNRSLSLFFAIQQKHIRIFSMQPQETYATNTPQNEDSSLKRCHRKRKGLSEFIVSFRVVWLLSWWFWVILLNSHLAFTTNPQKKLHTCCLDNHSSIAGLLWTLLWFLLCFLNLPPKEMQFANLPPPRWAAIEAWHAPIQSLALKDSLN